MQERLLSIGSSVDDIRAVAVTHEHTDHIMGLKTLLKKAEIPLIASEKTLQTLVAKDVVPSGTKLILAENGFSFGNSHISRFATSHDCEGSSGYTVTLPDGSRVAVCTDLGFVSDDVRAAISGCKAVLIESNHDIGMLKNGPYPAQLKLRILSDKGHLSNGACAAELPLLLKNGTTRFILGHLSKQNNMPMLALSCSKNALCEAGAKPDEDFILTVAKPGLGEVMAL